MKRAKLDLAPPRFRPDSLVTPARPLVPGSSSRRDDLLASFVAEAAAIIKGGMKANKSLPSESTIKEAQSLLEKTEKLSSLSGYRSEVLASAENASKAVIKVRKFQKSAEHELQQAFDQAADAQSSLMKDSIKRFDACAP